MRCVQIDAAQYCQYDFFVTQKQAEWLINGVMLSLSVENGGSGDAEGHELEKSKFRGVMECSMSCRSLLACLQEVVLANRTNL